MVKKHKDVFLGMAMIIFLYAISFIFFKQGLPCPILHFTGFYCPGCGISRMLLALVHADLYQAFRFNPLLFILLFLTIIYYILKIFILLICKKRIAIPQTILWGIVGLLIVYGIIRNIPVFSFLLPTIVN